MAKPSYRSLLSGGLILGSVGLLAAWGIAQSSAPAEQKALTAGKDPKFKNIKVLKKLPSDQLIPAMRAFNAALNVKCDFCHVIDADHKGWEKDDKPAKNMARKMVLLVQDMNAHEKVLGGQTTCFMCHHGHPEPITHPPAEEEKK